MIRKDIPLFQINDFQAFDRGEEVSQYLEGRYEFNEGDYVQWEAGCNINGYADVISWKPPLNGRTYVTLKKRQF